MAENPQWNRQVVDFLKRTGEDLKRTGEEIRKEAQRLVEEVRDPETQAKVRASMSNFGTWAKKTAEDAAGMIENAVKKAEDGLRSAVNREGGPESGGSGGSGGSGSAGATTAAPPAAAAPKAKAAPRKTVGSAKAGGSRKPGVGSAKSKKTIGKRK